MKGIQALESGRIVEISTVKMGEDDLTCSSIQDRILGYVDSRRCRDFDSGT